MKTQRKHGFTIVELVIVIAVIAILAAVLIPTFVSIIKKANDSAYVQERQSQRIDDIAQKIDNETWVSWEDMEVKIAEAISNAHPSGETLTAAEVNEAIKSALEEYAVAHQSDNTGLTEAQVQKIVSEATSGNVTLEQVQALIAKIPTGSSGVTTAQVQAIVNQALAGVSASGTGLNASQVNQLVTVALNTYANEHPGVTVSDINTAIAAALANFKTLSEEDVVAIVNNVTSTSASVITLTGTEAGNGYTVTSDNAGKTVYLMTNLSSTETYTISGEDVKKVVIDAPNMTDVVVACNAEEVVVVRTAMTSVHITGKVTTLEINKGHVEIESGAEVTTVTAAPSTNATVKVTVEGEVTTLNAEYQDHGTGTNDTIIVVDKTDSATVSIVASTELEASGTTTTNVTIESNKEEVVNNSTLPESVVVNVTVGEKEYIADNTGKVETNGDYVARIGMTGYETFAAAYDEAESGDTIVLLKSVVLGEVIEGNYEQEDVTSGFNFTKAGITLDLNGKSLVSNVRVEFAFDVISGDLTIKDSVGTGMIRATKAPVVVHCGRSATVNVYGGTIQAEYADPNVYNTAALDVDGTANIYGGTLSSQTDWEYEYEGDIYYYFSFSINNRKTTHIYGGTFISKHKDEGGNGLANCRDLYIHDDITIEGLYWTNNNGKKATKIEVAEGKALTVDGAYDCQRVSGGKTLTLTGNLIYDSELFIEEFIEE